MLLLKEGYPEEGELVLCTVKKIHFHSVFVYLDEYDKTGLMHISEVSPGRIRNIRDFVVEGKKIVCLVLGINKEKGHIDLSLRRVNENQKRKKINEIKLEQKAEKIVEHVAKNLNMDVKELYREISDKAFKKYSLLHDFFVDAISNESLLKEMGLPQKIIGPLSEAIKARIKEQEVEIGGELSLASYAPNGVEIIKDAIISIEKEGKGLKVLYEGGGRYKITITAKEYKSAEKILDNSIKSVIEIVRKKGGEGKFVRKEE